MPEDVDSLLSAAIKRRRVVLDDPRTTACRVFHGAADGVDGLVIEQLGPALVVQMHERRLGLSESDLRPAVEKLVNTLGAQAAYLKVFPRDRSRPHPELDARHRDPAPWIGQAVPAEFDVLEHGLRFRVRVYDGYSTGLFLDQRANRKRVRQLAAERRVLNTFAYTCAFSVVAAAGGARTTLSIDTSRRFLAWGRRSFEANALSLEGQRFIAEDVLVYLARAGRREELFDLIILDPPTFGRARGRRRSFSIAQHLGELVAGALRCLAADGWLLLSTNHAETPRRRLERAVRSAAGQRRIITIERPQLPPDFRGDPPVSKSILVHLG